MKRKYIIFELNEDMCSLAVDQIEGIVELDHLVKTNSDELNVMLFNSRSVPVIDPIAMMSFSTHKPTTNSRVLIMEKDGMKFGFLVENVMGIIDEHDDNIEEPSPREPQYVCGIIRKEVKVFLPEVFLTQKMIGRFKRIYGMELFHLEEGIRIHGEKAGGKDEVVEKIRLQTLNMLITATRQKVEESFLQQTMEIHDLIVKLR